MTTEKLKCGCELFNGILAENCDKHLMGSLREWHDFSEGEVFCPFCGVPSSKVKTNGRGFYRCKGNCKNNFFLLRCNENDELEGDKKNDK